MGRGVSGMTSAESFDVITDSYDLGKHVFERLWFHYEDWSQGAKNHKKNKKRKRTDLLEGYKASSNGGTCDVWYSAGALAFRDTLIRCSHIRYHL